MTSGGTVYRHIFLGFSRLRGCRLRRSNRPGPYRLLPLFFFLRTVRSGESIIPSPPGASAPAGTLLLGGLVTPWEILSARGVTGIPGRRYSAVGEALGTLGSIMTVFEGKGEGTSTHRDIYILFNYTWGEPSVWLLTNTIKLSSIPPLIFDAPLLLGISCPLNDLLTQFLGPLWNLNPKNE
jgi:hypothetical protein